MVILNKIAFLFLILLLLDHPLHAQGRLPVSFDFEFVLVEKNIYDFKCTILIDSSWWVLARGNDSSVIEAQFNMWFKNTPDVVVLGELEELPSSNTVIEADALPIKVLVYKEKAVFIQRIQVLSSTGSVTCITSFFGCDNYKCLPVVELEHEIPLP